MKAWMGLFLSLTILLSGCEAPPAPVKQPRVVLVRTVNADKAMHTQAVYAGEVRARIETDLAFRVGGQMISRLVDTGAVVKRHQVLAQLDPQDAQLAAGAAVAQVAAVQADVSLAWSEYERAKVLEKRNFISASVLDARRSALEAAQARLRQAEMQSKTANNQISYTRLRADNDGVIVAVMAEMGQVVAAGQPVFRMAHPGEREVLIYVPETHIQDVTPGRKAEIRLWTMPERPYAGIVREVAPSADMATRTYAVRVSVPEADDALKLGATASAAFKHDRKIQAVLPLSAVSRFEQQTVVWIVDKEEIVRRQLVEVAAFHENGALIHSGLSDQTRIVITGIQKLVEGEKVRPVEESAPVILDTQR